jgi:dihydroxyacetone kinase
MLKFFAFLIYQNYKTDIVYFLTKISFQQNITRERTSILAKADMGVNSSGPTDGSKFIRGRNN